MRKTYRWIIPAMILFFYGCRQQWSSVEEEIAYWQKEVVTPAHDVLYREQKIEPAQAVFDSLLRRTDKSSPYVQLGQYRLLANYHYFFTNNNEATGQYIDSALAVLNTEKLQERYAAEYVDYLIFGGEIAFRLANTTKANQYYFLAKQAADRYLTPCQRKGFTYNIAMVLYRQQHYEQSAVHFKEAYEEQASCALQTRAVILQQQEIQSNIGLCYVKLQQYDSALVHFDSALAITRRFKDTLGSKTVDVIHGVVYGNKAKVFVARNNLPEAEALYKESVALNSRPGNDVHDAMLAQLQLADVYQKMGRYPEMHQTLQAARAGLDTIKDAEAEITWNRLMYHYYQRQNQPLYELQHFKKYIALRDSLSDAQEDLVKANITYQLREKEQALQITLLKKDNQLARLYFWVAIAFALMAAFIIFLIYQNYRRTKRNIATLTVLHDQVNKQKLALEKAAKEKDHILHVVAHDLRSPIGITAYASELILMEERDEKDRAWLKMIQDASRQALQLTNELIGVRPGAGNGQEKAASSADLTQTVRNAVQMLQFKANEKGQEVSLLVPDADVVVQGQPERLHRVVANLLDNAIKFSPRNGKITLLLQVQQSEALLEVADTGIGIPEAAQAIIFEPYTPARRPGTEGESSVGLGLSICREIVEQHGGCIAVKSREGEGSVFTIKLPWATN